MTNEQVEDGKGFVVQAVQRAAGEVGIEATDASWGTSSNGRPALAIYVTGRRHVKEFSEEDLEDAPGDDSVRRKVEAEVMAWLRLLAGPANRIGF